MTGEQIQLILLAGLVFVTVVLLFVIVNSHATTRRQQQEIKLYQMYTKPLEELIREIRARQHEFDNHLNAILNMHLTVDNYDELVRAQSDYIYSIVDDRRLSHIPLLKISDKIMAGFLYTKMGSVKKDVDFEVEIGSEKIVTNTPEKEIIEVVGTLFDNAIDACFEENNHIKLFISSVGYDTPTTEDDKFIFEIRNEHPVIPMSELAHFFEKGWTTKTDKANTRGFGLYNAKRIVNARKGEITVENRVIDDRNYICFRIEL